MAPPSSSTSTAAATSVQVALRIRPTTSQDTQSIPARFQRTVIHATSSTIVTVDASSAAPAASGSATAVAAPTTASGKKQVFGFDQVHPSTITQHALFTSTTQPLISRFLEGFNCTILAYGQTSSGKTYTMTGVDLDANPSDTNNGMGIIPRAVSTIFSQAKKLKEERGGSWNYSIKGSFIEIYNEDLIDLLNSDETTGARREVQIREGKDGQIIWGGLREVSVKGPNEVMTLIRQGTSIRRTNETDMNAQSSRSHAIFSLTLIQKKYTGSGAPPRSPSPLPPGGRSPSRLARPGSMYTGGGSSSIRVSSPTLGRPSTPSFTSAMGRGGGLRPSSALGLHPPDGRSGNADDDSGEWVTIVSKFHFVDLAGSERLKRTAAAGERIKEGISINSGLLALGNVISALGDPSRAKSHTASHIPYRDSKLTRLLQDSLGGNAHTLMIACVSPTEWNVGETVNTLKYANRARNIKNRAVVNEKEDGWDDVEWLQGTITRLRKEVKQLKDGSAVITLSEPEVPEGASKKVLAQMTDLQNNYEDLREKFVERTEELARLRRELGERHRSTSNGAIGGTAKYEEIVGPVIEEYEKTIGAMEAELSLNRAALRLTNEMVEEKEEELAQITERHSATELYVEELRGRLAKVTEREASTEAYVRDLEDKIKSYDETSMTSSESMTDLKREVARYKEFESHSGKYIADLEARLARSDESIIGLQQTVERLESESERKREEAEVLQSRLENLKQDGASWRTDLEERERKLKELEEKMEEWERKKKEANDARLRLGTVVGEVALAKRSLEDLSSPVNGTNGVSGTSTPNSGDLAIENQLVALQQTHAATLADLSSITDKYRDALREISDLAAQIQEAKLSNPSLPESPAVDRVPMDIPPFKMRLAGSRSRELLNDGQPNIPGRRLFFRQAASAESLHSRSLSQSQSLSQELSSVRSRKASISSHGTSSSISHSPSHSHSRPNLSISLAGVSTSPVEQRTVNSLEKEIMRLQEVLKEREAEITVLETSMKENDQAANSPVESRAKEPSPVENNDNRQVHLSPRTMDKFNAIRKSMQLHQGLPIAENGAFPDTDVDESLDRLNELMLSMAQKETQHKEVVETMNDELSQVRRAYDELTTLSRDQTLNMSTEIEGLRSKHDEVLVQMEEIQQRETRLLESLKLAQADHATVVDGLRSEHAEALRVKAADVDALITRMKEDHETSTNALRDELSVASAALEKAHQEHKEAFGDLKTDYERQIQRHVEDATEILERTKNEHQEALDRVGVEHEDAMKKKDEEASAILQHTEEEYYNALTKLRTDHTEALQKQVAESNATLQRLREDHASELRMAEKARDCSLSESQSSRDVALQGLQEEHASAISRKEAAFAEDIDKLKTDHARVLASKEEDYRSRREHLKSEHAASLDRLKEESEMEVERHALALKRIEEESVAASSKAREERDAAMQSLHAQHDLALKAANLLHQEQIDQLKTGHETHLRDAEIKAQEERSSLLEFHVEEVSKLRTEHASVLAEVQAALLAAQEQHRGELEEFRQSTERHGIEERERLGATIAEMEQMHTEERSTLLKDRDLLRQELETYKSAAEADKITSERLLAEERERSASNTAALEQKHSLEFNSLCEDRETLAQKLESHETSQQGYLLELDTLRKDRETLAQKLGSHETSVQNHLIELDALRQDRETLAQKVESHEASQQTHLLELEALRKDRESLTQQLESQEAVQQNHLQELDTLRKEQGTLTQQLESHKTLEQQHLVELEAIRKDREVLTQKLESHKSSAKELVAARQNQEQMLDEKNIAIGSMERELMSVRAEKEELQVANASLRSELDKTSSEQSKLIQEASKRESLVDELEKHRSILAEMQENLQRVKDEKDTLQAEKTKQETFLRDLQAQVSRNSVVQDNQVSRPDRSTSFARGNTMATSKLPPPTPPPSIPPPPAPKAAAPSNAESQFSISTQSSILMSSTSSKDSQLESPATSICSPNGQGGTTAEAKVIAARIEEQAKHLSEQEVMIKTLNKQLTHCESDLQAHMDLVSTLETSLGDSEKNLRKARMQATELARERDSLSNTIDGLRGELQEAKREVVTVRRSIAEEKQSLESRLDEERRAKERARAQLDTRMEELQKRKSKFACL